MSDTSIGIIGAGPGGLALAIMLSRAGFDNFAIFDREDGGGGTRRGIVEASGLSETHRGQVAG